MVRNQDIVRALKAISAKMTANRDYLVELDQRNGDGDLGISMSEGFKAVYDFVSQSEDLATAKLFHKCASVFNEAAPSSLGTIMSFGFMGIARKLKGLDEISLLDLGQAMQQGLEMIMDKAGSKPGDKTILDSLCPGVESLIATADEGAGKAFAAAYQAAEAGMEATKEMRSVHGRAAYYGDKSIGLIDGGAVVGKLLFEALAEEFAG